MESDWEKEIRELLDSLTLEPIEDLLRRLSEEPIEELLKKLSEEPIPFIDFEPVYKPRKTRKRKNNSHSKNG